MNATIPLGACEADIVLRDGSTLHVRAIVPGDVDAILTLYAGLSSDSLYKRFCGTHVPDRPEVEGLCREPGADGVTLVGERAGRIVAIVQYCPTSALPPVAEVAFAVADDLHGVGIGTRLLEQLAAIARRQGITTFEAEVLASNREMLRLFRDSGFEERASLDRGQIRVTLSLIVLPKGAVAVDVRMRVARPPARPPTRRVTY